MADSPRIKMARIIHRLLTDPHGITFRELEDQFGINDDRTLRTYIYDLKQIPEFCDAQGESMFTVQGQGEARRVFLRSFDERVGETGSNIVSAYFALSMLRFLKGTALEDPMKRFYDYLRQGELKSLFVNLERKIYSINEWSKDYSQKREVLRDAIHALIHRKVLKIRYQPPSKKAPVEHLLKVYTLLQYRQGLYLIGCTEKGERITVFSLERIIQTELTRQEFHYPQNYSPEEHFDPAFGLIRGDGKTFNVVINFDKPLKAIIHSRRWHKTARIKDLKNGAVQLSMRTSALEQVVPWVLSFGAMAKVLEPGELKDKIKQAARSIDKLYG